MASIASTLKINDGMSSVLKSMVRSMNLVVNSFEDIDKAGKIDTKSIKAAKSELGNLGAEMKKLDKTIEDAKNSQDKFTNSVKASDGVFEKFKQSISGFSFGVLMGAGQKAFSAITSSIDGAIARVDTMNNFPKVMQQMGFGADESKNAIDALSKGIDGLPTTLDDVVNTAQGIAIMTKDIDKATKTTVALNNAFLSGGKGAEEASRGLTQYLQMMSTGKVDMQSWNSLVQTMGVALDDVSKSFGLSGQSELYKSLQSGAITFDQFNDKIIELNAGVGGFAERAKTATGGIATAFSKMKTGIVKGVANAIIAIDSGFENAGLPKIEKLIDGFAGGINASFKWLSDTIPPLIEKISPYWKVFVDNVSEVKNAFGEAISAIGSSFTDLTGAFGSADSVAGFSSVVSSIKDGLVAFAGFLTDNADIIAKVLTKLPYLLGAFMAFSAVKSVVGGITSFSSAIQSLAGLNLGQIAAKLFGLAPAQTAAGTSSQAAAPGVLQAGLAFLALGAGVLLAAGGITLLAYSAIQLAEAGPVAIAVLFGLIAALAALAFGASIIGPALTAGAVGFIAFGAAIALVGLGALLASIGLMLIVGCLPQLVEHGAAGAMAIFQLAGALTFFALATTLAGVGCLVLGVGLLGATLGVAAFGFAMILSAVGVGIMALALLAVNENMKSIAGNALIATASIGAMETSINIINTGLDLIGNKAKQAFDGLVSKFTNMTKTLLGDGSTDFELLEVAILLRLNNIVGHLNDFSKTSMALGTKAFMQLLIAGQTTLGKLLGVVRSGFAPTMRYLASLPSTMNNYGRSMIQSLINGINSKVGNAGGAVDNLVSVLIDKFKTGLGIHSPSTIMYEIGANIMQGMLNALSDSELVQFAEKICQDLKSAFDMGDLDIIATLKAMGPDVGALFAKAGISLGTGSMGSGTYMGEGGLLWPSDSRDITSWFGNRPSPGAGGSTNHGGLDIGAPMGAPIYAAGDGYVSQAGWYGGYGNAVTLDHGNGLSTLYGHMSAILTAMGQIVKQGQVIGLVGSTGNSTGPHLHFEVMQNGNKIDPGSLFGFARGTRYLPYDMPIMAHKGEMIVPKHENPYANSPRTILPFDNYKFDDDIRSTVLNTSGNTTNNSPTTNVTVSVAAEIKDDMTFDKFYHEFETRLREELFKGPDGLYE